MPKSNIDYLVLASLLEKEGPAKIKTHPVYLVQYITHRHRNCQILKTINKTIHKTICKTIRKTKPRKSRPDIFRLNGCEWCGVTFAKVWRRGPSAKGSLCNACGLYYKNGRTREQAKLTMRKSRGDWNN